MRRRCYCLALLDGGSVIVCRLDEVARRLDVCGQASKALPRDTNRARLALLLEKLENSLSVCVSYAWRRSPEKAAPRSLVQASEDADRLLDRNSSLDPPDDDRTHRKASRKPDVAVFAEPEDWVGVIHVHRALDAQCADPSFRGRL